MLSGIIHKAQPLFGVKAKFSVRRNQCQSFCDCMGNNQDVCGVSMVFRQIPVKFYERDVMFSKRIQNFYTVLVLQERNHNFRCFPSFLHVCIFMPCSDKFPHTCCTHVEVIPIIHQDSFNIIAQVCSFIQKEEHDIRVKNVSHGLYRLVHSATICRNSFLSSGCKGFQPFILAYFLAFSNLPYLLSERFILLTVVFILLIYDVVSGCKVTTFFRNGNGFVNIFELA